MTRYTFNGMSFFTKHITILQGEKQRRSWQLTFAPLRRLFSRLTLMNSATQIALTVLPITGLTTIYA